MRGAPLPRRHCARGPRIGMWPTSSPSADFVTTVDRGPLGPDLSAVRRDRRARRASACMPEVRTTSCASSFRRTGPTTIRARREGPGDWIRNGVLRRDERDSFYLHEHEFEVAGRRLVRRGIFGALRLYPQSEGVVLPHELTFPKAKADRLELLARDAREHQSGLRHVRRRGRAHALARRSRARGRRRGHDRHRAAPARAHRRPGDRRAHRLGAQRPARVHRRRAPPLRDGV